MITLEGMLRMKKGIITPQDHGQEQDHNTGTDERARGSRDWLARGSRLVRGWAPPIATAGGAALAGLLIERAALLAPLDSALLSLSFDSARVLLIDRVTITLVAALVAALLSRQRRAAWAGATLFYLLNYLLPFVQSAQHPPQVAGVQVRLLADALRLVAFQLACLGGAMAALGAAIGGALNDVLVAPLFQIARWARQRRAVGGFRALAPTLTTLLGGLLLVGLLMVSGQQAGTLLTFGPTNSLYAFESAGAAQAASSGFAKGTIVSVRYASASLHGAIRTAYIYLPPSYATSATQRYPTLYLLHGSPGGPYDWLKAAHAGAITDALIAAGKMRETILIFPDGNGPLIRYSEWANSYDGRQMIENAIADDLVTYVDSHYRTIASPAFRAIGGLSEGGYGAANIALHHPQVFGTAICLSGYYLAQGPVFGGTSANALSYRRYNSPLLYMKTPAGQQALRRLNFIIGDGTEDGFYLQQSITFTRALQLDHARVIFMTTTGGHSWTLWTALYAKIAPIAEPAGSAGPAVSAHGSQEPVRIQAHAASVGRPQWPHSPAPGAYRQGVRYAV
jgi:enterochelin esterase-like enzyme